MVLERMVKMPGEAEFQPHWRSQRLTENLRN
jgi:hypothetical protein